MIPKVGQHEVRLQRAFSLRNGSKISRIWFVKREAELELSTKAISKHTDLHLERPVLAVICCVFLRERPSRLSMKTGFGCVKAARSYS